jgi:hypothetical protein
VNKLTQVNTKKSRDCAWRQFQQFCDGRKYNLNKETSVSQLALILKDFAFNMTRSDGEAYKEGVVKTIWNTVAKILQQKYNEEFNIIFDPFKDNTFECARTDRDAKRKQLQKCPEKRKISASSLSEQEIDKMFAIWDETTPDGLQRKFFHVASYELVWRGGEACNCLLSYFEEEFDNYGNPTGRIAYNPIFSKTAQGGSHRLTKKRWLVQNTIDPNKCPVRYLI